MRKMTQLFVVGFLVFGLIVLNTASLLVPVSAETKTENQQQHLQSYEPTVTENSILSFNFTKDYYAVGETIVATMQVSSPLTGQPSYDGNGAIVTSAVLSKDNLTATVKMQITGLGAENSLTLLLPTATETMQADVFFYTSHSLVFCSETTSDSVKYKAADQLCALGKITELEKESFEAQISSNSIYKVTQVSNAPLSTSHINNSMTRATTGDTYLSGTILLQDEDGDTIPVKDTVVHLYDQDGSSFSSLGHCKTDENGFYEFAFTNDISTEESGYDLYIGVRTFLTNGNVKIPSTNNQYIIKTNAMSNGIINNVATGSENTINLTIDMTTDAGKAFSVLQAIYYGHAYADQFLTTSAQKRLIRTIPVYYPVSGSSGYYHNAEETNNYININVNRYRNWDPILHEYGHFFSNRLDFDSSVSGIKGDGHWFNENAAYGGDKTNAIGFAWNEGVSSVFAILALQFYSSALNNFVHGIGNSEYNISPSYDLENKNTGFEDSAGEDCEGAVGRILYDFYDTTTDEIEDSIALGHADFWNILITAQCGTLNEFYQYVLQNTTLSVMGMGQILSRYGVAPQITRQTPGGTPIAFSWTPGNNGQNPIGKITIDNPPHQQNPNDEFVVQIRGLNSENEIYVEVGSFDYPISSTSYVATSMQWSMLPSTFIIRIYARSSVTPVTGWYIYEEQFSKN